MRAGFYSMRQARPFPKLLRVDKLAKAEAKPKRVRAGIERGDLRVRNMEITEVNAPMIFPAKNIYPNCPTGREVEGVRPERNLSFRDQEPAANLDIRRNPPMRLEIPLHNPGIKAESVRFSARLKHHYNRKRIHGIFKSSSQCARAMRIRQDPAVAHSGSPNAIAKRHLRSADGIAACPRPNFPFMTGFRPLIVLKRCRCRLGSRRQSSQTKQGEEYQKRREGSFAVWPPEKIQRRPLLVTRFTLTQPAQPYPFPGNQTDAL
jgi:hypothetical protein